MILFIYIFITLLFKDISLNYFFICILTNRIYLVSITPKLTSPKLGLHLWMKSKQFFCRNTFYRLYNILSRHHWNTLYHKMNMILVCPNFNKMYFKSLLYLPTYINQAMFYCFRQNIPSVLYRTNEMTIRTCYLPEAIGT